MTKRDSRARNRADADKGVREIMTLMVSGQWVPGASHADIAFKHGVAPATVKDWATSASRVIRLAIEQDPEDIRARLVATLDNVVAKAMTKTTPDLKAAVAAISEAAKLLGLVTQKHEVAMSEDQARAKWRELTGVEWSGTKGGVA